MPTFICLAWGLIKQPFGEEIKANLIPRDLSEYNRFVTIDIILFYNQLNDLLYSLNPFQ